MKLSYDAAEKLKSAKVRAYGCPHSFIISAILEGLTVNQIWEMVRLKRERGPEKRSYMSASVNPRRRATKYGWEHLQLGEKKTIYGDEGEQEYAINSARYFAKSRGLRLEYSFVRARHSSDGASKCEAWFSSKS